MKCTDYNIIRVRYYADEYRLKKYGLDDKKTLLQHRDRARDANDFIWKLAEKLSGKDSMWWHMTYMFSASECFEEYLEFDEKILVSHQEGWKTYYIPKEREDVFQWFKDNLINPYKVVKKTYITYLSYRVGDENNNWKRKETLINTEEIKLKHNLK
jgi:hypothetical protein